MPPIDVYYCRARADEELERASLVLDKRVRVAHLELALRYELAASAPSSPANLERRVLQAD